MNKSLFEVKMTLYGRKILAMKYGLKNFHNLNQKLD